MKHNHSATHALKAKLRIYGLHTVCEEARCPNMGECFSKGAATFMILGSVCTRRCGFCNVDSVLDGKLCMPPASDEPARVAEVIKQLGLKHAVITSVTRDDLPDEGAGQFAEAIKAIRHKNNGITVEVLTPDFNGRSDCLKTVCDAGPDIFNHNVECVRRLSKSVRYRADYYRSLNVLRWVKVNYPNINLKSGFMVGLGERYEEVVETLGELCDAGCDVVTIGQYLRPKRDRLPIVEYIKPETFENYKKIGEGLGLKKVFSGPFVRSSGVSYGSQPGA